MCVTNIIDDVSGCWLIMSSFCVLDRSNGDLCSLNSFAQPGALSAMTSVAHEALQNEPLRYMEAVCERTICRALVIQGANRHTGVNLKGLNGRQIYKVIKRRFKWVPKLHMGTIKGVNLMQYSSNLIPYLVINPWAIHPI